MNGIRPVYQNQLAVKKFVSNGLWPNEDRLMDENAVAIGFINPSGKLIAGVVYHDFEPEYSRIEMTMYAVNPGWFSWQNMGVIAAYPFNQLGLRLLVMRTDLDNSAAIGMCKRSGAKDYLVPNMRGAGRHEVFLLISRDDWQNSTVFERLKRSQNGQRLQTT